LSAQLIMKKGSQILELESVNSTSTRYLLPSVNSLIRFVVITSPLTLVLPVTTVFVTSDGLSASVISQTTIDTLVGVLPHGVVVML
jgi:hypothetical protein